MFIRSWIYQKLLLINSTWFKEKKNYLADSKAVLQIEFLDNQKKTKKKLNAEDKATDAEGADQSMVVLAILESFKEIRLKFPQGSVAVL